MPKSGFSNRGLRGAGFSPAKPTITYNSNGKFNITNYNPMYIYRFSLTSGTASTAVSGSNLVVTMTSTDTICTITPSFGPSGTSTTFERKAYVNNVYHPPVYICTNETFDNCGPPLHPDGSYYCSCGTLGGCGGGDCCGWVCHAGYYTNASYTADQTPASQGYTDSGTEWYKIT
jgi:hypothetical protein